MGMRALVLCFLAVVAAAAQRETVLPSRPNPSPRELGAFYFDALNESQVWVTLQPAALDGAAGAITLNFTVRFAGHRLSGAPRTVAIRAQPVCPTFFGIPRPELRFTIDGSTVVDLTRPGATFQFIGGCLERGQGSDTIVVEAPVEDIEVLAGASRVDVDALGFPLRFADQDLSALGRFVTVVSNGVSVP